MIGVACSYHASSRLTLKSADSISFNFLLLAHKGICLRRFVLVKRDNTITTSTRIGFKQYRTCKSSPIDYILPVSRVMCLTGLVRDSFASVWKNSIKLREKSTRYLAHFDSYCHHKSRKYFDCLGTWNCRFIRRVQEKAWTSQQLLKKKHNNNSCYFDLNFRKCFILATIQSRTGWFVILVPGKSHVSSMDFLWIVQVQVGSNYMIMEQQEYVLEAGVRLVVFSIKAFRQRTLGNCAMHVQVTIFNSIQLSLFTLL